VETENLEAFKPRGRKSAQIKTVRSDLHLKAKSLPRQRRALHDTIRSVSFDNEALFHAQAADFWKAAVCLGWVLVCTRTRPEGNAEYEFTLILPELVETGKKETGKNFPVSVLVKSFC
jgi:hypothetical protein